jgi:hypothetical protein
MEVIQLYEDLMQNISYKVKHRKFGHNSCHTARISQIDKLVLVLN